MAQISLPPDAPQVSLVSMETADSTPGAFCRRRSSGKIRDGDGILMALVVLETGGLGCWLTRRRCDDMFCFCEK